MIMLYIFLVLSKYNLKFEKFILLCIFFLFYSGDRRLVLLCFVDFCLGLCFKNCGVVFLILYDLLN